MYNTTVGPSQGESHLLPSSASRHRLCLGRARHNKGAARHALPSGVLLLVVVAPAKRPKPFATEPVMRASAAHRAPCWADIVADTYDDDGGSGSSSHAEVGGSNTSSCAFGLATSGASSSGQCERSTPSHQQPRRQARRHLHFRSAHQPAQTLVVLLLIATALCAPLATGLLFDPGAPSPPASSTTHLPAAAAQKTPQSHNARSVRQAESQALASLTREPISLHPGCRQMTDLFDNVCPNPWTPLSSVRQRPPRSELIVCPLATHEGMQHRSEIQADGKDGPRERVYAITGTITVPEGVALTSESTGSQSIDNIALGLSSADGAQWPQPGDEGFWRQRDGELEWVPAEPRALLENEASSSTPQSQAVSAAPDAAHPEGAPSASQAAHQPDPMQTHEYDAWSASVGGEDSDTWLSFEEWRQRHLAAEKERVEAEKQRHAAGRKNKSDRNRDAAKTAAASSQGETIGEGAQPSEPSPEGSAPSEDKAQHSGDEQSVKPEAKEFKADADGTEAEKQDKGKVSQDHAPVKTARRDMPAREVHLEAGAIPAVGNPSEELSHLKHRWNFASFDCAAVVHRSNPSAKFASAILSEKKDRYMLSPCPSQPSEEQFVLVELCDEIIIDTVVLANFEFFSRMFKRFRVRVSRSLHGGDGDWVDIGTFRARNIRGLQVFRPVNPPGDARFYRYMRIDFLEHYGSEYYCPVSLLRVYGLTQMDDYIREEEEMRKQREAEIRYLSGEDIPDDDSEESGHEQSTDAQAQDAVNIGEGVDAAKIAESAPYSTEVPSAGTVADGVASENTAKFKDANAIGPGSNRSATRGQGGQSREDKARPTSVDQAQATHSVKPLGENDSQGSANVSEPTSLADVYDAHASQETRSLSPFEALHTGPTSIFEHRKIATEATVCTSPPKPTALPAKEARGSPLAEQASKAFNESAAASNNSLEQVPSGSNARNLIGDAPTIAASGTVVDNNNTSAALNTSVIVTEPVRANATAGGAASASTSTGAQQSQTQSSAPHQGGSESIYRAITKRLNALETNATLSLQYLDHSRQMLRETFQRMERNQRDKIGQMLRELNTSNWRQIESLKRRQQVDLQQAIFEFDMHRQQTDAERRALLAQVHILSNEVLLEKRFGIAQLVLLLGLFVFMAFTRGSRTAPLLTEGIAKLGRTASIPSVERRLGRFLDSPPHKAKTRQHAAPLRSKSQDAKMSRADDAGKQGTHGITKEGKQRLTNHAGANRTARSGDKLVSRSGGSSRLGRLLVPPQERQPVELKVLSEVTSPNPNIKLEDESHTLDVRLLDTKPWAYIEDTAGKSSNHNMKKEDGLGIGLPSQAPGAANRNPLSRNTTLTRASFSKPKSDSASERLSPVWLRKRPSGEMGSNDADGSDHTRLLSPRLNVDDSMNSDWGTERSEEDGDESDTSSSRLSHVRVKQEYDADTSPRAAKGDVLSSPRLAVMTSPNHFYTPKEAAKAPVPHPFGLGPERIEAESPSRTVSTRNGRGSSNALKVEGALDDQPRTTFPPKGETVNGIEQGIGNSGMNGGRDSSPHLNDCDPQSLSPLLHFAESDAEEDQPTWSPVRSRRAVRRSLGASGGSEGSGNNSPRRTAMGVGVWPGSIGQGSGNRPISRNHTPTAPPPPAPQRQQHSSPADKEASSAPLGGEETEHVRIL